MIAHQSVADILRDHVRLSVEALILFRQLPNGFRSADLRHNLAALSARHSQMISQGAATYQLRRLRLHGLIERVPKSFRYRVTDRRNGPVGVSVE